MSFPLMPKVTAIWLIENTALTFSQIAEFCGLHILEVQSLADGDMDAQMVGFDPVAASQLTVDEIKRCEANPSAKLQMKEIQYIEETKPTKKYMPRSKRQDRPDAIAWLVKYYPDIPDKDICNLLGTTRIAIKSIKNKTHKNYSNIKPRSPVALGLCSEAELDFVIAKLTRE